MDDKVRKTYFHIVRERYCKGCGICVAFCPKKVLVLRAGKVFAEKPELCIGCTMCELRCPDYAIEVRESGEKLGSSVEAMDLELPPEAIRE